MSDAVEPPDLMKYMTGMAAQVEHAEKTQRQRTASDLTRLDCELVVLRANLAAAEAEVKVYEVDLLPGAPEISQEHRTWLELKVTALRSRVEACQQAVAAQLKLNEATLESATIAMGADSVAKLMRDLTDPFRGQSGEQA